MSPYNSKRTRNLYDPRSDKPFKISRSKIDLFIECGRCFYMDRRLGVGRPQGFPFNLNNAVDHLLKLEFDKYRSSGKPHPLMTENNIDAIPYANENLNKWRTNNSGVQYLHEDTNFTITGAIDDVWINSNKELIVVDYKATSKNETINELNNTWHIAYKRQMEIYQWLLKKNDYQVSNIGYFVYCNARRDKEAFNSTLDFEINVIPYEGKTFWVEKKIFEIKDCLQSDSLPESSYRCDYCKYIGSVHSELLDLDIIN